jgi:RNA 3'-terminal phosphate cyclase
MSGKEEILEIDGSMGEGGGQVLRSSLSLSAFISSC